MDCYSKSPSSTQTQMRTLYWDNFILFNSLSKIEMIAKQEKSPLSSFYVGEQTIITIDGSSLCFV